MATAFSAEDGTYGFANLLPGQRFRLRFLLPIGFRRTAHDATGDDTDSDADPLTGLTDGFEVNAVDATRWDAGYVSILHAAGDRVWKDANGDGLQDPREPGVAGVQVLLFRSDGQVLDIRNTDARGMYRFGGLFTAPHYLLFVAPPGFVFTADDQGADDDRDSDTDPATGRTPTFNPVSEVDATRWDAGLVHDCPFPDAALLVTAVFVLPDGDATFELSDPNDPARVTGYRARRSDEVPTSIAEWPIVGSDFDDIAWSDPALPPPGVAWFYQFAAVNAACDAEGPW